MTASGKNVAPQKLENLLKQQPVVSNAVAIGDRKPYITALITLDRAAIAAVEPSLEHAAVDDPALIALVEKAVLRVNEELARYEQVRRFRIVDRDFTPETGELTVTLKLKRRVIEGNYRDAVETLYSEAS